MATVTKIGPAEHGRIGPAEHGRPMTFEEFQAGDYEEGYRYELIDGRLYVSPEANMPDDWVAVWVQRKLDRYADAHPRVLKHVTPRARVFVSSRRGVTNPQPDVAAYRRFPGRRRIRDMDWRDYSPVLVVEVLTEGDPDKDLVRNVALYRRVPSIKEYWIIDSREDANTPTMTVYRRRGRVWRRPIQVGPGERYTTPLLPDFELVLDTLT
jgi:Uma2 family endonuclease